jgi:hypothetical protein
MRKKNKIKVTDFEERGGALKLRADGHNRSEITNTMYKMTDGLSIQQRRKMMENFYNRRVK